jgi:hypothetical protein
MSRMPATGKLRSSPAEADEGAVVDMLRETTELPLPEAICVGLKLHDVKAGKPGQETLTLFGKLPVFGFTVTLNSAVFPRATATLLGVADIAKSKPWFGKSVKISDAEWAMAAGSVPRAFTANTYVCADALLTVTVNGTPELLGTIFAGASVQLAGAPAPQLRATVLLYAFTAVIVPLKTAVAFTCAERLGLLTAMV